MLGSKDYVDCFGIWKVSDDRHHVLGIYQGFIDEIAFTLASYYGRNKMFNFRKVMLDELPEVPICVNSVDVRTDPEDSNICDLYNEDRIQFYNNLFQNRDVMLDIDTPLYAGIKLIRKLTDDDKRAIALAKLTDEEKSLLGVQVD